MSRKAYEILSLNEKEMDEIINEPKLLDFLKLHSSWDNVANSVKEIILKYAKN